MADLGGIGKRATNALLTERSRGCSAASIDYRKHRDPSWYMAMRALVLHRGGSTGGAPYSVPVKAQPDKERNAYVQKVFWLEN